MPKPSVAKIDDKNPKPKSAKEQKDVKDWLKAHGHDAAKVEKLDVSTDVKLRDALLETHSVSTNEYRVAGGGA